MKSAVAIFMAIMTLVLLATAHTTVQAADRIPVIYDTDIGDDIDDTWALCMLLKSPEFDVKMISTTAYKAHARARLIAKLLTVAGRTDIPIALGRGAEGTTRQDEWCDDFQLDRYAGKIHDNGPQAIVDLVNGSEKPIMIIAVGPLQSVSDALEIDPSIAPRVDFVGMHGSLRTGYRGSPTPSAEYNVRHDAEAARRALLAPWKTTTITPLDTCGVVRLEGDRYSALERSGDPLIETLLENFEIWAKAKGWTAKEPGQSSILYDTVAVYLASPGPRGLITFETLSIDVTDDGFTRIDPAGREMEVATSWNDLGGFLDHLVEVLTSPVVPGASD
jgi:inosine-uridine nucleoside N-ribohydrolase